ncbi:peptide-methionine (S)-S-oxide reductase MsrA [Saccharibacillus sp. CPCC 101409]|uniref:peptide-methionine (S)-S-oxide reductase MsrA n=1 Tax=Saccharibacillus sp. CPCC 101409 TaxID=3058041 RepID=UPI002673EFFB|nr:peptide-methionine (S)-S-oxide reductase MsrA [Saccharibacillus sp. CPCC 101409]MDO3411587.1 peptide-methionine (S)-S-oxide reductase MsrA [Saccharibacillus sp. CPCC 101409]
MRQTDKLTFAMGCFWGPEDRFARLPGVTGTRVGYAGGESETPSYRRLGGHSEAVEVEFDPGEISLEELLERFWSEHNPEAVEGYKPDDSRYRSLLFYRDERQRAAMERARRVMQERGRNSRATRLLPLGAFYPAEEKHQRYEEKKRRKTKAGRRPENGNEA